MRLDFVLSGKEQEERRKEGFWFRSKDSNIHAATEDLSFNITLKRVETQKVREGFGFYSKKERKGQIYSTASVDPETTSQNPGYVKMEIN